jgi:Xaa-Pro dipeptidase
MNKIPVIELNKRMQRFCLLMDQKNPEWEMAVIISKINQYYFTGTMQEGILLINRGQGATLWVRRSIERALDESLFSDIRPMDSYRTAAQEYKSIPSTIFLESEVVPLAMYQRFQKYFPFKEAKPLDAQLAALRAVKSKYEIEIMLRSGKIHARILEELLPGLLHVGMSEMDLAMDLYSLMVREGHHGVARFGMFDTEAILGHIAFGESSIYPTSFNGPGGNLGLSPAVPLLGNRNRKLEKGDLVFIDVGCGVEGYHTDKTMVYMMGQDVPGHVRETHEQCVAIQNQVAAALKPGAIPSEIYHNVIDFLSPDFLQNFMGFGNRQVKFLGHGIGLLIDEYPVIAHGFDEPLEDGMVLALEPKKGIAGVGMVGIENSFLVTPLGGECITGSHPGLLCVDC